MLQQFNIKKNLNKELAKSIIDAWMIENNKIFHLISDAKKNDIRDFYERIGNIIGEILPKRLAQIICNENKVTGNISEI